MTSTSTPLIIRITKHLPLAEKGLLTALLIGAILMILKMDSLVTRVALLGLALTFFLLAYRPADIPRRENDPFGFSELLGWLIVPKVLWISSAVSSLGIAFFLFDFGNDGYKQLLFIGGLSIGIGATVLLILFISGVKHIGVVAPVLLRAIPLAAVDCYLLFQG